MSPYFFVSINTNINFNLSNRNYLLLLIKQTYLTKIYTYLAMLFSSKNIIYLKIFQPFLCLEKYSFKTSRLSSLKTPSVTSGFQNELSNTSLEQLQP